MEQKPMNQWEIPVLGLPDAVPVYQYDVLPSTNLTAKALSMDRCAVVLAKRQTKGRGRLGRSFFSEGGIYMSLVVPKESLSVPPKYLTSLAAVAVCRALAEMRFDAQIKWVNDIMLDGKKLCGILAETVSGEAGICGFVVGIGMNVGCPSFPPEIAATATAIPLSDKETGRLITRIIEGFFEANRMTPHEIVRICSEKSCVIGKPIRYFGAKEGVGTAIGLHASGGLIVRTDTGETVVLSGGEISVRPR